MSALALVDPEMEADERPAQLPPHDLQAERIVLAAIIENPESFALVGSKLDAVHFHNRQNRKLYEAVTELTKAARAVDYVSVKNWLHDRDKLVEAGGLEYLGLLERDTPFRTQIEPLADRIVNFARVRELIQTTREIAASGYSVSGDDAEQFIDQAEQKVFRLAQRDDRVEIAPMSTVCVEAHRRMLAAEARQGAVELPTGLERLDKAIGGLGRGRVTVLAARPGMGKTALVTGTADNIASSGGLVAFFSLEMPRWQLAMRMACARVGASAYRGINGWLHADERALVMSAHDDLKKLPLWIDETGSASLQQIRAKARLVQAKSKQKLALIVVDYLQLMRGPRERNMTRDEQLSDITAGFKRLAKELDCAVVYLSQLNRDVEKRPDKHPMLSDLRESGGIEQDADDVIFIYRPEYYQRDKTPDEDKGVAELVIAKQRNGPTTIVRVGFDGSSVTFSNRQLPHPEDREEMDP